MWRLVSDILGRPWRLFVRSKRDIYHPPYSFGQAINRELETRAKSLGTQCNENIHQETTHGWYKAALAKFRQENNSIYKARNASIRCSSGVESSRFPCSLFGEQEATKRPTCPGDKNLWWVHFFQIIATMFEWKIAWHFLVPWVSCLFRSSKCIDIRFSKRTICNYMYTSPEDCASLVWTAGWIIGKRDIQFSSRDFPGYNTRPHPHIPRLENGCSHVPTIHSLESTYRRLFNICCWKYFLQALWMLTRYVWDRKREELGISFCFLFVGARTLCKQYGNVQMCALV